MSDKPKLLTHEERQAIRERAARIAEMSTEDDCEYVESVLQLADSDIPRLQAHIEVLEAKLRDCSGAVDALLMLIDLEAPPDFGSNGIVGPGGGPDEGRVLTYELMNRCRDASKRAREVLK